ncbi:MAG: hypothetical protein QOF78_3645 [Phycisphaerales bacterium]|jgi:prepilin-type processing-associated H-X9-DG protein|nr:hypothetical protein [Phycisphaerales bacterium]
MRTCFRPFTLSLICLLGFIVVAAAPARGQIAKFITDQTIVAGEADLTKVDGAAIESFLMNLAKAAGVAGAGELQTPEAEVKADLGKATKWINDVKAAGATSVYLLMDSRAMQRTGPVLIIPVSDDKAAALAALIPVPGGPQPPRGRPNPNMPQATVVPGVGVIWGAPGSVNAVKAVKPAPRADLTAAFKAAGTAPIKLAFALDEGFRQQIAKNVPPMILGKPSTLITKDFQWGSVAATPPPNATVKAVVQSTDAASAKSTHELIVSAIMLNQQTGSKLPDDLITLITPQAQGSQLVSSLDTKDLNQVAVALREPLARARQVALRVQSSSNIRQILQTCLMHSNENKGAWPADMKELEKSMTKFAGPNVKRLLTNPQRPSVQPAYVYIKPVQKQPNGDTVVIYESHKDFGDGVNVGFADGHVEWVAQKQQFDQMLAKTAQEQ